MMNDKEFEKAQASIMNKKAKLMKLRSDRAEACKKMSEIEQAIARTEKELLGEENDFIVLCGQKSQLLRERALQVGEEIEQAIRPQQPVDKLTILFLAANPQDTQKLALGKEVRSITDAIRRSEGRDGIEFFSRWIFCRRSTKLIRRSFIFRDMVLKRVRSFWMTAAVIWLWFLKRRCLPLWLQRLKR